MIRLRRRRKESGFTLPEVLIALVLFSFILLMLYGSLYSTGRSWRVSEVQVRENDDKRLILSFIRRQVEETSPILQVDIKGERVMFLGDDASLQFVSHLPTRHVGGGLYFLKFEVMDNELLLKYTPLTGDKGMFEEDIFVDAEEISLLTNIETIDLDYFGRETSDAEATWRDGWDNKQRLPELVRFQLAADRRDPWPELLIALRSQAVRGQPQLTLHLEEDVEG